MQSLGLIGLLIVIALGAWWLTSAGPASDSEPADGQASYSESIDAAKQAAEQLSN